MNTFFHSFENLQKSKEKLLNYDDRVSSIFDSTFFKTGAVKVMYDTAGGKNSRHANAKKGEDVTRIVPALCIYIMCSGGARELPCTRCADAKHAEYFGCVKYAPSSWETWQVSHMDKEKEKEKEEEEAMVATAIKPPTPNAIAIATAAAAAALASESDDEEQEEEDEEQEEEDEDQDEEEEEDQPLAKRQKVAKVPIRSVKITLPKVMLKSFFKILFEKRIAPLLNRIDYLERNIKCAKGVVPRVEGKSGGQCKGCGKSISDAHKRLKPSLVPLALNGHMIDGGAKDVRSMSAKDFNNKFVAHNKYCKACNTNIGNMVTFDVCNKNQTCIICRISRARNAGLHCADCNLTLLRTNHATYKKPLHNAFQTLVHTVADIKSIETSYSMDKTGVKKHEFDVEEYGSIDFLVLIETNNGMKHMFAIEVLATKIEHLPTHAHKFARARELLQAHKTYVIAFDIKETGNDITLGQKIDILRRWVILAIRYAEHLPNMNNWWMFPTRNAYPMSAKEDGGSYSERMTDFYKTPVKIMGPPKGGSLCPIKGSDWEFASDLWAVGTETATDPFKYITQIPGIDVNEFMFKGGFPNYGLYNVDKEIDMAKALSCTDEACTKCAKFYSNGGAGAGTGAGTGSSG